MIYKCCLIENKIMKTAIIILSVICFSLFMFIGFCIIFRSDIYRYLYITYNKNDAYGVINDLQTKINKEMDSENYKYIYSCIKNYHNIIKSNIQFRNIVNNQTRLNNQYTTIYNLNKIGSVYQFINTDLVYGIIKDKICYLDET